MRLLEHRVQMVPLVRMLKVDFEAGLEVGSAGSVVVGSEEVAVVDSGPVAEQRAVAPVVVAEAAVAALPSE